MMGALYEDVENFFGDIFAWYGRLVARLPWLFVIVPLVVCSLLGLGLFGLEYETEIEVLYTPIGSQASEDQDVIYADFPDTSNDAFYLRHEVLQPTYAEVIVTRIDKPTMQALDPTCIDDILTDDVLQELSKLHQYILTFNATSDDGEVYGYEDVCAYRRGHCVIDGLYLLPDDQRRLKRDPIAQSRLRRTYQTDQESGRRSANIANLLGPKKPILPIDKNFSAVMDLPVLSGYLTSNNQTCHNSLRLRYNLINNDTERRTRSLSWEIEFLVHMQQYHSELINVSYTVSESLDIELRDHVGTDTRFLGFSVIAMVVFATIIGSGANCVTNHVMLAYTGVFASLLAILGSFGLLSLLGVKFVNLSGVMPFLVLGVGADDMFQLMTEWRQSNIRDTIEERLSSTLRATAVSITITSLTDLIAFCIGATSPFVSIRNFCACSGVAVLLCYMNELTFYLGCIVLHARRVEASRHWLTFHKTTSREEMEEVGSNRVKIMLCAGNPPRRPGEEGGICRKVSRLLYTYYPRFLLHWLTKMMVFVLFIAYISVSFWGAIHIKKGLKLEWILPDESYLSKYLHMDLRYYPENGPIVTLMVQGSHRYTKGLVLYHHPSVQEEVRAMLARAEDDTQVVNGSSISWLGHYVAYRKYHNMSDALTEKDFINDLRENFFQLYPSYINDVKFSDDTSHIVASRFYIKCAKFVKTEDEAAMMQATRRIANSSPLNTIAFSPEFIFFEHYVSIMKNTLLPVGVTMIGLLFVALVFIPHPIAVTCVTLAMISIVVGMVGFMRYWGLSLSAITVIQVIMSLGVSVSFTVQMSHAFMTATGKNRNERVTVAIEKVGIPILNGALSSLLCAVMLSFGSSFIFTSFFKTMILVFFLGIIHSLVFLPVMLSFIGPRRTSKPRVFIPVSPSSRSLQDTYRANSVSYNPSDFSLEKLRIKHNQDQSRSRDNSEGRSSASRDLGTIHEDQGSTRGHIDVPDIQISLDEESTASVDEKKPSRVSFQMGEPSRENTPSPPPAIEDEDLTVDKAQVDVKQAREDFLRGYLDTDDTEPGT